MRSGIEVVLKYRMEGCLKGRRDDGRMEGCREVSNIGTA